MSKNGRRVSIALITFLFTISILPLLAPILMGLGLEWPAKLIYTIYIPTCHQKASRSIHFFDYQVAFCARDTFIYLTMAITSLLSYKLPIKPLSWKWIIPLSIPIAINGGYQLITQVTAMQNGTPYDYAETTNMWRMITGTLFAAGFALYLFPSFFSDLRDKKDFVKNANILKKRVFSKTIYFVLWILIFNFILYAIFGFFWNLTSTKYKPSGIIDNISRIPGYNYEQEGRGNHAAYLIERNGIIFR